MAKGHIKGIQWGVGQNGVGEGLSRKPLPLTSLQKVSRIVGLPDEEISWMGNIAIQHILSLEGERAQKLVFSRYALQAHRGELALAVLAV